MKNINKKSIVLLICAALLLTFSVSGTVAYLVDATGAVENQFKPATVDITVTDEVDNGVKKNVVISNSSTIPVFIRVAVVANWYNADGEIVAPWNDHPGIQDVLASGWAYHGGYYYYTSAVQPSQTTVNFFAPSTTENSVGYAAPTPVPVEGAHLEMTIISQAIQAEPITTVTAEWKVDPTKLTPIK